MRSLRGVIGMSAPASVYRHLEIDAEERDLARHLCDAVEAGAWVVAGLEERDRYIELARAALAWGVPRPPTRPDYTAAHRLGREEALKEVRKALRKLLRELPKS
jgi:hypothetical protein